MNQNDDHPRRRLGSARLRAIHCSTRFHISYSVRATNRSNANLNSGPHEMFGFAVYIFLDLSGKTLAPAQNL
jgi:hypothetical protein